MAKTSPRNASAKPAAEAGGKPGISYDLRPGQSLELLKELHILTRDGRMNQDSQRKLKQVYHLYQFIEPLLEEIRREHADIGLVAHGAGRTNLGCILSCLFLKARH